jgi:oligosaccharide translocation protein RFT1
LNQALVRLATPQTFGTAAIQFELLLSTILFLSREGVRNALLRTPYNKGVRSQDSHALVSNISLLPVFLGIPIATLASLLYIYASSSSTNSQSYFQLSVIVYAFAAFFELLSEPLYIRAQNELRLDIRIKAEGTAVISKTIVTFLILAFAPSKWALLGFAVGQAAYGLALMLGFYLFYIPDISFVPRKVTMNLHGKCVLRFLPDLFDLTFT